MKKIKVFKMPEKVYIVIIIIILLSLFFLAIGFNSTITGLAVYSTSDFLPTEAVDSGGYNQIYPNGGTVDISDGTTKTITYGTSCTFVEVRKWSQNISQGSSISNVFLKAENDEGNTKGADLIFQFYNSSGAWQTACTIAVNGAGTFSCDLYLYGINAVTIVNSLKTRIKVGDNNGWPDARLDLDFVSLAVNSTTEENQTGNQTSQTGTVLFSVQKNIFLTLTDNTINFGALTLDENRSSEDINDFFILRNDGSIQFDVYSYGIDSPFLSSINGANTLPNNYYLIHANYSDSGIVNTTYVPVPADISTKNLLVDNLQHRSGLDTAKIGITVRVPLDEEAGTKTADLVVYAEAD